MIPGKATTGSASEVYEKEAYNETSTKLLELYLVGHVNKTLMLYKKDPRSIFGVTLKPGL